LYNKCKKIILCLMNYCSNYFIHLPCENQIIISAQVYYCGKLENMLETDFWRFEFENKTSTGNRNLIHKILHELRSVKVCMPNN